MQSYLTFPEVKTTLQKLKNKKVTYQAIGEAIGTGRSNISSRAKAKSPVKPDELEMIEDKFNVKFTDDIKRRLCGSYDDYKQIQQKYNSNCSDDLIDLPVKGDVSASMGHGLEVADEKQTGVYQFSKNFLDYIGANPKFSDVIFSQGDSMYPTIEGGDCLIVDKSKTEIYDGKIYCVRIDKQLYAKRLQKIPPSKIKIISDNKEKYDPFYVDFSKEIYFDFAVIGEVKWWSRIAR